MSTSFSILPFVLVIFIIAIGVVLLNLHFHKNLYKQKEIQEALKQEHQIALLQSSIIAQEAERKRIAQDLHDELGGILAIVRMHLKYLEDIKDSNQFAHPEINLVNIRLLTESALAAVRSISHKLMPPQLEKYGLLQTLESIIEQLNNSGNIRIELNYTLKEESLEWNVSLAIYRITMELINNTIKHSKAEKIDIVISTSDRNLMYVYQDNGGGFILDPEKKGLGLKSIEGRVLSLNGSFNWQITEENNGFLASISLPILHV